MRQESLILFAGLLAAIVPGCNCVNDIGRYQFTAQDIGPDVGPDGGFRDAGDDSGQDGGGHDAGSDMAVDCSTLGTPVDYRLDRLEIPTLADVSRGAVLGHDVDGVASSCDIADFPGGVDNAFLDLAAALPAPTQGAPLVLQDEIDAALACSSTNGACAAPPWTIRVASGGGCAEVSILHGETQSVLAGPFMASLDGGGHLRGEFDMLNFDIAYRGLNGLVSIPLVIRDGIFSATVSDHALSDVVIGGVLLRTELLATFSSVVSELGDGTLDLSTLTGILNSLYDVEIDGVCDGMSVGLRASASRCPGAGSGAVYRLGILHVPTSADANGGAIVGHDVDNRGSVCDVPDYSLQVDNSLIDLALALSALTTGDPIDLQGEIDAALACAVSGATGDVCRRLDIYVRIATGAECALVSLEDASGYVWAAERVGTLGQGGVLRAVLPSWTLTLPVISPVPSAPVSAVLPLSHVVFSAEVSGASLANVVIGGVARGPGVESFIAGLLTTTTDSVDLDDIRPILPHLYDVEVGGQCIGFSVGFTGAGTAFP